MRVSCQEQVPGRTATKAVIATEERGLLERQRAFRFAADRVPASLARCRDVEASALIGSVARPLRREVPRFAPYRQLRLPIAHDCKDVDLAAWVSRVDGLDELRRARAVPATRLSPSAAMGRRCMKSKFSCSSLAQTAISVDFFGKCPAGKRDCLTAGCGQHQFLKQHDDFSFWPQATAEGAAVRLYDRISGGLIAQAVDLPLVILDADP